MILRFFFTFSVSGFIFCFCFDVFLVSFRIFCYFCWFFILSMGRRNGVSPLNNISRSGVPLTPMFNSLTIGSAQHSQNGESRWIGVRTVFGTKIWFFLWQSSGLFQKCLGTIAKLPRTILGPLRGGFPVFFRTFWGSAPGSFPGNFQGFWVCSFCPGGGGVPPSLHFPKPPIQL